LQEACFMGLLKAYYSLLLSFLLQIRVVVIAGGFTFTEGSKQDSFRFTQKNLEQSAFSQKLFLQINPLSGLNGVGLKPRMKQI